MDLIIFDEFIPISIHAPREGGDYVALMEIGSIIISIHAPREGGDLELPQSEITHLDFNPRPPRGGRLICSSITGTRRAFQSTPPARGATP